jgi:hypothetical protein
MDAPEIDQRGRRPPTLQKRGPLRLASQLMSEELEVLKDVPHRLDDLGIPYMLTGSFAANFYAVP